MIGNAFDKRNTIQHVEEIPKVKEKVFGLFREIWEESKKHEKDIKQ